jgi:predicted MFS family arabinose efflux permease
LRGILYALLFVKGFEMQNSQHILTRDFILVFIAQVAFSSALQLLVPTLPIYLKSLGSTEIEIGILIGAFGLASVVSRPLTGRALIRMPEKTFMFAGAALYTISSMAYIVIPPFWPLLFVRILQGTGFGFFHTATTTYIINITEVSKRARAIAYLAVAMNIASAIAPPVGIELANRFGFTCLFLVCAAVSLCMVFVSVALGKSCREPVSETSVPGGIFMLSKEALPPSIVGFIALFVWASLTTFYPLYARSVGIANPGLFFTVMATMLIFCRTLGGRILDIPNRKIVILPCIVICMIAMVILFLCKTQVMFLVAAALWGISHGFLMPALIAFALERAGSSAAPVVATFYAFSDTGLFLGPLVMGVVAQYTSYPFVFLGLFVVSLISLFYFWYITRKNMNMMEV